MSILELASHELYSCATLAKLNVNSTKHLPPLDKIIGQERARQAIEFAMSIEDKGYNIYAVGENGLGKKTMMQRYFDSHAQKKPQVFDWCYVANFQDPRCPQVLQLPAGTASSFKKEIENLMLKLSKSLPLAFDNEMYHSRADVLTAQLTERQQTELKKLGENAKSKKIQLSITSAGEYQFVALNGEEPHTEESFSALSEKAQMKFEKAISQLEVKLRTLVRKLAVWEEDYSEKQQKLDEQIAKEAIEHHLKPLLEKYKDIAQLKQYLQAMYEDILENLHIFLVENEEQAALAYASLEKKLPRRYQINVLVSQEKNKTPLIIDSSPSYHNIFGYVENTTFKGTVFTDFSLIRPGSIHRANGGVLIMDAIKVLERPFVWDGLKRALSTKKISLHSLEREVSLSASVSLEPEEIPLNVKIILLGDYQTYRLLQEYDSEFTDLFRVMADFEVDMLRNDETELQYAQFISSICHENQFLHCNKNAIARIIEHSSRQAEHQKKLSLHSADIINLLRESNYQAQSSNAKTIRATDVEKALASRELRVGRFRDHLLDNVKNGITLLATSGNAVGQINALSVLQTQDFNFGVANRISATSAYGKGEVIDIERSVKLGGNIHSKGVMILTAYLSSMLGKKAKIPLTTRLTFEQSYAGVDGDSASMAELCAVISAITQLPLRQDLAITGSMNQFGEAQAIGGVNEKIEGFFDVCTLLGAQSSQGVIIPRANKEHLMLRKDILHAVEKGKFHIYVIDHVNEALELLTGISAEKADKKGKFKAGTVFYYADNMLTKLRKNKKK